MYEDKLLRSRDILSDFSDVRALGHWSLTNQASQEVQLVSTKRYSRLASSEPSPPNATLQFAKSKRRTEFPCLNSIR